MKVLIDKLEGNYAVVECPDRTYALIPRKLLEGAREGDTVEITVKSDTCEVLKARNELKLVQYRG